MPAAIGLRHPASASCLGRHLRLAGRCPNNSSLFPPLAAVVVVALWASIAERVFFICSSETPAGVSELLFYGRDCGGKPLRRTFVCNPFFAPQKGAQGLFGVFQGDSMHFRGHSRRIALLLPPFVVYYKHRAVLCSICHSRNSYRAENRPVTANRAVFCFLRVRVVHRVVSAHLRGDSCPKPSKAAKTWYTGYNKKRPAWRALEKERILCKNGSSAWFWR